MTFSNNCSSFVQQMVISFMVISVISNFLFRREKHFFDSGLYIFHRCSICLGLYFWSCSLMESICIRNEENIYQKSFEILSYKWTIKKNTETLILPLFSKKEPKFDVLSISFKEAKIMKDYGEIRKQLKKTWNYRDLRVV